MRSELATVPLQRKALQGWRSRAQVLEGWREPCACGLCCLVTCGEQGVILTGERDSVSQKDPVSTALVGSSQNKDSGIHSLQKRKALFSPDETTPNSCCFP